MEDSIEDLKDMYETFLEISNQTEDDVSFSTWMKYEAIIEGDIRTAQLVKELEEAKRKIWEQEIIIRKYEKDMQAIAEVLGNISQEAFK